jgi:hypothetical protein
MTPAGRWRRRALPWALRATLAGPKLKGTPWLRCMAQVATVPWHVAVAVAQAVRLSSAGEAAGVEASSLHWPKIGRPRSSPFACCMHDAPPK